MMPRPAATCLILVAAFGARAPARAAAPEQLEQLEPERGGWLIEYEGQFGGRTGGAGREHGIGALYGLTDDLAVGGSVGFIYGGEPDEPGRLRFDSGGVAALLRFSDPEADALGMGLLVEASLDRDGTLAEVELRFIAEKRGGRWWGQANAIVRRVDEEDERGTHLAFAAGLHRAVADGLWIGAETSGQAVRLGGYADDPFESAYFLGPSVIAELPLGEDRELELGLGYLRRLGGGAPAGTGQLFVQFRF